jgi:hypothetical protein
MRNAAPKELRDFLPGKTTTRAYIMTAMISTIHLMDIDDSFSTLYDFRELFHKCPGIR